LLLFGGGAYSRQTTGDIRRPVRERNIMSAGDKAKDVIQKTVGKAEEAVGKHTDDAELTAQGQYDQSKGEDRLQTEKAKDDAGEK